MKVARCTIARLMRQMGLTGAVRGKSVRTTISDPAAPCPLDRVNRQFQAAAERPLGFGLHLCRDLAGFVYVAFVIDAFARRIVGWRVSRSARTDFVLDALEQALYDRRPVRKGGLVHHSDRGVQYVSIKYTDRLAEAGIEPSVGSVGDSYDNALAETVNGLYKTEVIHRRGPWRKLRPSSSPRSNGSTGSTIDDYSSPSETSRPPKPKPTTMPSLKPADGRVGLKQTCLRKIRRGSITIRTGHPARDAPKGDPRGITPTAAAHWPAPGRRAPGYRAQ